ncbi:MAG: preprotein translocase subunit SecE [Oscillospiraceae bacterium]|nr:preprotein translocase subunit SecE [Oscillospiraceae bacterium]
MIILSAIETNQKKSYKGFASDFFREIKKVVWPTPGVTFRNTFITFVAIFIVGVFVFLIDFGVINLLALIMNTSGK